LSMKNITYIYHLLTLILPPLPPPRTCPHVA
jgi:hypothetical protein